MKSRFCILLLGLWAMVGCSHSMRLYPVKGPLSDRVPLPVLVARITGGMNVKKFTVSLSDGEVCKGRWATVPRTNTPKGAPVANVQATNGMSSTWDAVYGPGFYISQVTGAALHYEAVVYGDRGTVLNAELFVHEGIPRGMLKGVVKDNKENIYKLVW